MPLIRLLLVFALVLVAQVAAAQTPVATSSSLLGWDQDAPDLATAQGYTYNRIIDGGTPTLLAGHKCGTGPSATVFACVAPIPVTSAGSHAIALTASNVAGTSLPSTPLSYIFALAPATPRNLRIVPN